MTDPPAIAGPCAPVRATGAAVSLGSRGPADLRDWLRGEWMITRRINGDEGRFEGRAQFTSDPDASAALVWHERGRVRFGGHQGTAERTLRIEPTAHGVWQVRFADGRPFHDLDLRSGPCEPTHSCGPDVYHGRYTIEGPDRFTVTWRVAGPHKDDVIESVYARLSR